jgi:hypothetical protein
MAISLDQLQIGQRFRLVRDGVVSRAVRTVVLPVYELEGSEGFLLIDVRDARGRVEAIEVCERFSAELVA